MRDEFMISSIKNLPSFFKELFMTRCLSCGYLHHEIALNCPKCGSFYTEIVADETPVETKKNGIVDKIKDKLEHLIHHGENHD